MKKITDFRPQAKNANKHTQRGIGMLEKSVQSDGWIDAQTTAANLEMISGSARLEVAADKFQDVEPIIVHSDGSRPVIVVRDDIPNLDDPRARRLSVAANQIGAADWNPDGALLAEWDKEDEKIRRMFQDGEWQMATEGIKGFEPADELNRQTNNMAIIGKGKNVGFNFGDAMVVIPRGLYDRFWRIVDDLRWENRRDAVIALLEAGIDTISNH